MQITSDLFIKISIKVAYDNMIVESDAATTSRNQKIKKQELQHIKDSIKQRWHDNISKFCC